MKNEQEETMNYLTTFQRVENLLREAGAIEEQARISGKPLTVSDELFIREAKKMAEEINFSQQEIDYCLERGASLVRRAMPV